MARIPRGTVEQVIARILSHDLPLGLGHCPEGEALRAASRQARAAAWRAPERAPGCRGGGIAPDPRGAGHAGTRALERSSRASCARAASPVPTGPGCKARQVIALRMPGIPARTWRGAQNRPPCRGAGGSPVAASPGQYPACTRSGRGPRCRPRPGRQRPRPGHRGRPRCPSPLSSRRRRGPWSRSRVAALAGLRTAFVGLLVGRPVKLAGPPGVPVGRRHAGKRERAEQGGRRTGERA